MVDEVVKENGGTASLFVKVGDEYVRVATNMKKDDGSRAIGTILDHQRRGDPCDREGRTVLRMREPSRANLT
jgi:hypothetical protein